MRCARCDDKMSTKRTLERQSVDERISRLFREFTQRERYCVSCDERLYTIEVSEVRLMDHINYLEKEIGKLEGIIAEKNEELRKVGDAVQFVLSFSSAGSSQK